MPPISAGDLEVFLTGQQAEVCVSLSCPCLDYYYGYRDDLVMHAASTMKIPVMIEVYRQAEKGIISLDDSLAIKNLFRSIVDGSEYSLDAGEDSEGELYRIIGDSQKIRDLVIGMITASGNLATNILIDHIGIDNIRMMIRHAGADGLNVLRGVEDIKAFNAGINNTTTARALTILLSGLAGNNLPDINDNQEMIDILCRQEFIRGLPAGVPAHVRVANKTGWITGHNHDAGIIYIAEKKWYALSILTRGFAGREEAQTCIARISEMIYNLLTKSLDNNIYPPDPNQNR